MVADLLSRQVKAMQFPNLKETHFLESLWWGLEYLAGENKKIEDRVRGRLQLGPEKRSSGWYFLSSAADQNIRSP